MALEHIQQEINTLKDGIEELAQKRAMFEIEFDVAMNEFNANLVKLEQKEASGGITYRDQFVELLDEYRI